MSLFNLFTAEPPIDYDSIDAVKIQDNLLVMSQTKERQAAIKKLHVGSLVNLKRTRQNGHNVYVVADYKTDNIIGEISYGTSDYLAQNFKNHKLLGKVIEIGRITQTTKGNEVYIEYKVYL